MEPHKRAKYSKSLDANEIEEVQMDVYVLTNMHAPPVEGNFTEESGQAIRPRVVEDYNAHIGFVDKSDRMVNSYEIARRTWK